MLIVRRDQEAKSIPKKGDVREISESHKFEHGLASPFVLSAHISNELPNSEHVDRNMEVFVCEC
jgi:hypothetical protein